MEEMKKYILGDVCSRLSSGKGISSEEVLESGPFPVIGGNGLRGYSLKSNFSGECGVIGRQGAYCGNVRYFSGEAYMTEHAVVVVGNEMADTRYLTYLLSTMHLGNLSAQSAQPGLSVKTLAKQEIMLPSLSEQKRRASILASLEDKIALNNRINHNLEEQAQALYKSWFVDFEPFKGGEFADSELGLIPAGWRVGTLSELGDIVAGGTPPKSKPEYYTNNGIAWLTPKDLSVKCNKFTARGETDITEDGYKNSSAKLMPRGSVLFSSRAPIGYISIAKGYICTNQGFKSVVPTYAGTAYIYYWLLENTDAIESQASGSTFKEASGSLMKSFPALVPEKSVLDSFEKELAPILNEQEVLEKEIYHAEQIRNSLLPRLMSGELVMNC
ncbi:MAG: restriction endonuclease subunit S [Bacteroidales bacterium]|nr:restriction endonuclease subunit S [Bacteroidales bacterium]